MNKLIVICTTIYLCVFTDGCWKYTTEYIKNPPKIEKQVKPLTIDQLLIPENLPPLPQENSFSKEENKYQSAQL